MRQSRYGLCALPLLFGIALPVTAAPVLPHFDSASFTPGTAIDHDYFPLLDGLTRIYVGEKDDGGEIVTEHFELTVIGTGPAILGVQTTARRDRAYEDGLLVEDTFDYYAQDDAGNVWYFGEDVVNYRYDDDDNLIGTDNASAWRAGENSALPGFVMPADLTPALHYYQEFAPFDAALDQAQTLAADRSVSLAIGAFDDVLAVLETNPWEPDAREIKYYAPGLGLIAADEGLGLDLDAPEIRFELTGATPVPLPAPCLLLGAALAGLITRSRPSAR